MRHNVDDPSSDPCNAVFLNTYVGEHDTDVADQHLQEGSPLVVAGALHVEADGTLHHGVLTHAHHGSGAQSLK